MSRLAQPRKQMSGEAEPNSETERIKGELEKVDDRLAQNGGINCGWEPADHKDFLRIRTKHGGKTTTVAFMTELMRAVADLTDDKIFAHIKAYDTYLELSERKKDLLAEYKEAKKKEKELQVAKVDTGSAFKGLNADLNLENNKNAGNRGREERQKIKEELERWRK